MKQFQPGEHVYVRIAFQHGAPISNAYIVFVHKDDDDEHIVCGFRAEAEDEPLAPDPGRIIELMAIVEEDKKPGVYVLDKINFETYSGNTLDYQGDIEPPSFEVIPEDTAAPVVENVAILSRLELEAAERREQS